LLTVAGIYSGSVFVWIVGLAALAFAVVVAASLLFASIQLDGGVLTSTTFLNRRSVSLAEITEIVPFHRTFIWKSVLRDRSLALPVFDVRTGRGSAGIWLNPEVYGESGIAALIEAIGSKEGNRPHGS
jgi:hypothetical protein